MKKTIQALLFVACMCGVGVVKAEERDAASVCYGAFAGLIDVKQDLMEQNPTMGDKVTLQAEIEMYRDAMLQIVPEPQMFYDLNEADRLYGQDNFDDLDIIWECEGVQTVEDELDHVVDVATLAGTVVERGGYAERHVLVVAQPAACRTELVRHLLLCGARLLGRIRLDVRPVLGEAGTGL